MNKSKILFSVSLLALSAGLPSIATAQTAIEEVVVTAQRREERLQDVPVAVSAIPASALAAQGASDIQKLSTVTPGLTMSNQRGALQPYLRGVGTQNTAPGDEGSIAVYIDGVYMPSPAGNVQSLSNIQRIEVLRGPQGTLFGRNATGGLIHIITRDPTPETRADVSVGYANYKTLTGSFYGSTGLSDTLAVDLALSGTKQGDGWGRNLTTGDEVNKRRDFTARAKALWSPTDDLKVTLTGWGSYVEDDRGLARGPAPTSILPGNNLIDGLNLIPGQDAYDTRNSVPYDLNAAKVRTKGASVKVNYDLGWGDFQSLTAYNKIFSTMWQDQDGTALAPPLNLGAVTGNAADGPNSPNDALLVEKTKVLQQEFLLNNSIGKLDLTSGVFLYYASSGFQPIRLRTNALSGGPTFIDRESFNRQITRSYAGFMQGTFNVTEQTGVTVGVRYTMDQRDISGFTRFNTNGPPPANLPAGSVISSIPAGLAADRNFNKFTYRLALDHRFTEDVMGYVSYSRGFKSGVFNNTSPAAAVEPEVLDAAAIGIKSDLFDRTIRLNVEAFHYDYKNLQLSQIVAGTTRLLNAAKSKIKGIDVEAIWQAPVTTGSLRFSTNFSYIDAKYVDFPGAPAFYPAGTTRPSNFTGCGATRSRAAIGCAVNATGNDMLFTPEFSGTLAADYTYPLAGGGEIAANATLYYNDGYAGSFDGTVRQPSYHTLSAQIGYTSPNGDWGVRVWGANLTKEVYYLQYSHAAYGLQVTPGAPRTYGVTLSYHLK